jgi:hypothetical protein
MKALGASALLIALLFVATSVGAQVEHTSTYMGTLAADQPYTIFVDNGQIGAGKTVVTVYYLTGGRPATAEKEARLGRAIKFEIMTLAAGERQPLVQEIPKGTRLIVVEGSPPRNPTVLIELVQGLFSFPSDCQRGCRLIFDLQ